MLLEKIKPYTLNICHHVNGQYRNDEMFCTPSSIYLVIEEVDNPNDLLEWASNNELKLLQVLPDDKTYHVSDQIILATNLMRACNSRPNEYYIIQNGLTDHPELVVALDGIAITVLPLDDEVL